MQDFGCPLFFFLIYNNVMYHNLFQTPSFHLAVIRTLHNITDHNLSNFTSRSSPVEYVIYTDNIVQCSLLVIQLDHTVIVYRVVFFRNIMFVFIFCTIFHQNVFYSFLSHGLLYSTYYLILGIFNIKKTTQFSNDPYSFQILKGAKKLVVLQ